jgi:hypothetical protein
VLSNGGTEGVNSSARIGTQSAVPCHRDQPAAEPRQALRGELAIWGRNDPFFLPAGAEAFRRDIAVADVRLLDTGHLALGPRGRDRHGHPRLPGGAAAMTALEALQGDRG